MTRIPDPTQVTGRFLRPAFSARSATAAQGLAVHPSSFLFPRRESGHARGGGDDREVHFPSFFLSLVDAELSQINNILLFSAALNSVQH